MKILFGLCVMIPMMFISLISYAVHVDLGPRPYYLIDQMKDSPLKDKLQSCQGMKKKKSSFSIGHRGATLMFPEHTEDSYRAAARMGAGVMECDVTFTKDLELVCRHAQNDLHSTTNILKTPLSSKCTTRFRRASMFSDAQAECRSSDITLAEFRTLQGKMHGVNVKGKTVDAYLDGIKNWQTDLYTHRKSKLMSHAESIDLFRSLGVKFAPELKKPVAQMPFNGFTQQDYAQKLVDEYKAKNIDPSDVFLQSFNLDDVLYWIEHEPEFGKQAVYLDGRTMEDGFDNHKPDVL
ncbi:MAG: hypothetical protein MK137_02915, partial [Rickettsiales bacterium]|nr:hypothetical protein [Rickettsiales bacterium]